MRNGHHLLAFVALAVLASTGSAFIWQLRIVDRNRRVLAELRSLVGTIRDAQQQAVLRRSGAEDQARPGQTLNTVPPDEIDAAIRAFLRRVDSANAWFDANPRQRVPEMRYLKEQDWFEKTAAEDTSSTAGLRKMAADLRNAAIERFDMDEIAPALKRFAAAHDYDLPASVAELVPYLTNPGDAPILARYENLFTGDSRMPAAGMAVGLKPESIVDPTLDDYIYVGAQGVCSMKGDLPANIARVTAEAAYANATGGDTTWDAATLLPYYRNADEGWKAVAQQAALKAQNAVRRSSPTVP